MWFRCWLSISGLRRLLQAWGPEVKVTSEQQVPTRVRDSHERSSAFTDRPDICIGLQSSP